MHREVVCTVPGQGEGAGQQGRIKVVSGALTGLWGMMDLGFLVIVILAVTFLVMMTIHYSCTLASGRWYFGSTRQSSFLLYMQRCS